MQRNYEVPKEQQAEVQQQPVPVRMSVEQRKEELAKSKSNLALAERLATPEIKEAWKNLCFYTLVGPICPVCGGKGHTLFKCPSYSAIKSVKIGIPFVRPMYNMLVAKEMVRIHEEALANNNAEVIIPDINMDE